MSSLIPIARSLTATPAYSPVQNAILEQLRGRQGGDVLKAYHERQVKLASHIHDMQAVAAEMNLDKRGFADAKKQVAFSRALAGLVKSGAVTSHPSAAKNELQISGQPTSSARSPRPAILSEAPSAKNHSGARPPRSST